MIKELCRRYKTTYRIKDLDSKSSSRSTPHHKVLISLRGLRKNINAMVQTLSEKLSKIIVKSFSYQDDKDMWFLAKKQIRRLEKSRLKVTLIKNQKNKQIELIVVGKQLSEQLIKELSSLKVSKEEILISDSNVFHKLYSDIVLEKKVAEYQQKWSVGIYLDSAKQTSNHTFDFVISFLDQF
jgi:hypothetical protein